jgi:hypothetical protein
MKPIHKFNNGRGATLCNQCSVIITTGLTDDLYCEECKDHRKKLLIEIMKEDEDLGLYIEQMEKEEPKQDTLEEAKNNAWDNYEYVEGNLYSTSFKNGFEQGAKWSQEQDKKMYSEEEVEDLIYKVCGTVARLQGIALNGNHIDTAYKKFKKK